MTKIIFFGTSEFAVPVLEALVKAGYDVAVLITTTDEPVGRKQILTPPPVKIAAQKLDLNFLQPDKLRGDSLLANKLVSLQADIGIVASYGKIIPPDIIKLPKHGMLNIHPSLLPKYRGPSPIQYALLNGDEETGVTIMKIDEGVDHGPIVAQSEKLKTQNKLYEELHDELAQLGAELLIKTLPDYLAGKIEPVEQDHSQATFTKIIRKEDGQIDWHKTAKEIYNQFRAFHLWPGIWTKYDGKILKITDCKVSESQPYHNHDEVYIGKVYEENNEIYIPCQVGHLNPLRVQLEGGKDMIIKQFLSGHKNFVGSKLL